MDNIEFAEMMRSRTKSFALRIIKLYQNLPKSDESRIIGKQLLRSATSVAANYRAASRARSGPEYYAKICIVVEETDEALFWIEILEESHLITLNKLSSLKQEIAELVAIFSKTKSSLRPKTNAN